MSTRPQIKPFIVINAGDMSGTLTSSITIIDNITLFSYSYSWSGSSPIGTVSVQASNDVKLLATGAIDSNNPGTWNTLPLAASGSLVTSVPVSGNTGNGMIDVDASGFFAIRTVYTFGSGTGALTATVIGKVG